MFLYIYCCCYSVTQLCPALCNMMNYSMPSPSQITALLWWRGLHISMKLWAMPCRATQDGQVIVVEFWQNVIHWRREWQTTPVCLPWEHHKLYICVYLKKKSNQFHSSNKIQKYLVNTYYPQNNFEYLNHSLLYHSLCNHSHIVGHLHCLQFYFLVHSGEVNIFVDKEFNTYI